MNMIKYPSSCHQIQKISGMYLFHLVKNSHAMTIQLVLLILASGRILAYYLQRTNGEIGGFYIIIGQSDNN